MTISPHGNSRDCPAAVRLPPCFAFICSSGTAVLKHRGVCVFSFFERNGGDLPRSFQTSIRQVQQLSGRVPSSERAELGSKRDLREDAGLGGKAVSTAVGGYHHLAPRRPRHHARSFLDPTHEARSYQRSRKKH